MRRGLNEIVRDIARGVWPHLGSPGIPIALVEQEHGESEEAFEARTDRVLEEQHKAAKAAGWDGIYRYPLMIAVYTDYAGQVGGGNERE